MIYLFCGFMGAGKSTLLNKIQSTHITTEDLDTNIYHIFAYQYSQLGDYIRNVGWDKFRKDETAVLMQCLNYLPNKSYPQNKAVALGGGIFEVQNNLSLIKSTDNCMLIWLDISFDICINRIHNDKNRPQLDKSTDELKLLFDKRKENYSQADIRLTQPDIDKIQSYTDFLALVEHKTSSIQNK